MKKDLKMNNNNQNQKQEAVKGIILLTPGVFLLAAGAVLVNILPTLRPYLKLAQGIGLFLIVIGLWNVIQYFNYKKNPTALKKARVESMDERKLWIRYRSGNNAFKFGITITYLLLLVCGATQGGISADLIWWGLAAVVVGTLVVYVVSLIRYESKY
jgi:hypothetical protein